MKKTSLKLIALLLVTCMLIPIFVSCNTGKGNTDTTVDTQKENASGSSADNSAEAKGTEAPDGDKDDKSDNTHIHAFDKQNTDAKYLKASATCTSKATYCYSCECGETGTETFEHGEPIAHTFDRQVATAEHLKTLETYTDGAVYYKSCVCGANGTETFTVPTSHVHEYNQTVAEQSHIKTPATCTDKAVYYKSCICGANGTATFEHGEALDHSFEWIIDEPASKTQTGLKHEDCTRCDAVRNENTVIPMLTCEHASVAKTNQVDADHHNTGKKAYWYCAECNKYFSDEACLLEIADIDAYGIIAKVEHEFGIVWEKDANSHWHECSCGDKSDVAYHTYNQEVVDELYKKSDATCTDKAVYYKSCICGAKGTDTFEHGEALDHSFEWIIDEPASKTQTGLKHEDCTRCDAVRNENTVIPMLTCEHASVAKTNQVDADHHNTGKKAYWYCAECNRYFSDEACLLEIADIDAYGIIAKVEHEFGIVWEKDANSHWHECSCGDKSNVASHTYNQEVVDELYKKSDATCTDKAVYYKSCVCGAKGIDTFEHGEKLEHKFNQEVTTDKYLVEEATCTDKAKYYYSCECGETGTDTFEYGSTIAHTFDQKTVKEKYFASEATHEKPMEYYYSCECGEAGTATFEVGEPIAHIFDKKVIDAKYLASIATAMKKATYYYSCECGEAGTATFEHGELDPFYGFTFTLSGDEYIVSKYKGTDSVVVIPSVYNSKAVTSISASAFSGCTGITSITIPSSIKSIGNYAFQGCRALTEINFNARAMNDLSESNYVFAYAGQGGTGITVNIGADVTKIPAYLFYPNSNSYYVPKITSVVFDNESQCESIGAYAFACCTNFESITIPSSLTSIATAAFYNCLSLNSVYITDISTWCKINFGDHPLNYDLYLNGVLVKDLIIPSSVTSISVSAFRGCISLESITIPSSVTSIGNYAFGSCTSVTEINFNATITSDSSFGSAIFQHTGKDGDGITLNIGANVTEIPSFLFVSQSSDKSYEAKITRVVFAEGSQCTSIGENAFYYCTTLKSVTIPENVKSIGEKAFYNCTALTEVIFNATAMNTLYPSDQVFYGAGKLGDGVTVIFGANVEYVPGNLFNLENGAYETKIISVVFAEGSQCTEIGTNAFYRCVTLQSVTIPENIKTIGISAFNNCTGLIEINFNATAMDDDWTLASENKVFYDAGDAGSGITLNIGANVTKIPARLFNPYNNSAYAPKITSVVFAAGSLCTSIGSYAFNGCVNINAVYISDIALWCNMSFGNLESNPLSYANNLYINGQLAENLIISSGITNIGNYAFYNCTSIRSVTISGDVTSIGSFAFKGCTALTEINFNATSMNDLSLTNHVFYDAGKDGTGITVNIGADVTKIPAYLFYPYDSNHSPKIISVVFAENGQCESIGTYAFAYCISLESITIPSSVQSIDANAFYNCKGLEGVTINGVKSIGTSVFYGCTALASATIESGVESIGSSAFYECTGLTSITIPDSVTSIGNSAFFGCTGLTEINFNATAMELSYDNFVFGNAGQGGTGITVNIGANVTKIPAYLFCPYGSAYLPKITSVIFAENSQCESIGNSAFSNCRELTSITIPSSVTSIGSAAFSGCSSLNSVYITDITAWCSISFGDVSANPLYNSGNLYLNGELVTNVVIPDSVTSIGSYAFYNCTSLESVTIGSGVTSIGNYAFYKCTALTSVTFKDTSTWYKTTNNTDWSNQTGGTSTMVTNPSTNVTYFKSTYDSYYWYKK